MKTLTLAAVILLFSGCATHNQVRVSATEDIEIKNLAVIVPDSGTFEVQHARLRQDATSAVLFGLIGYAIESGYRDSLDAEKEQQVREYVAQLDCAGDLARSIQNTFREESDIASTLYRSESGLSEEHDALATFRVEHCGFTLVQRDSELFVPFITLNAKAMSADGKIIWDDKETFTGKKEIRFDTMLTAEGGAAKLLDDLLAEAGARLAYQIIYQ